MLDKERPKLVEELLTSRTHHKDNDPIILNKTTFFDKLSSSTALPTPEQSSTLPQHTTAADSSLPERSARVGGASIDSVNTDVLLQSTDEFMKAIHSFSESDASNKQSAGGKTAATKSTTRQSSTLRKSTADRLSTNASKLNNGGHYELPTPRSTNANKEPTRRSVADSVTAR